MRTTTITCILATCCLALFMQWAAAAPRCKIHDRPSHDNCKYGTARDWCRNTVCAKGPGESCGGYRWENGKCGLGMICSCGRCSGCSIIDGTCSPHSMVCVSN
ncbi:neuroparsin-A-like [Penaeus chinensis]|uniref:neuroparsin-A-like n=1 Tax=Penaeus chinensis TaxID=139456 RepID=UPI001FB743A3|nr:neuroparsin-A-like [Penaeus chinensis]